MQWTDSGIVLGTRRLGETSLILELMTALHGRHLGVVKGGRGKRFAAMLQPGNSLQATWQARIEDQLGIYTVEIETHRAAGLMGNAGALYTIGHLASLLRLLPERDPQEGLHAALDMILGHLDDFAFAMPLVVRFEVEMLRALGFGLDLSACAATGSRQDLVHVSPKTGRAVSRAAGLPYADRLLPLPSFLTGGSLASRDDILAGLDLTAYFLERHVFAPRGLSLPDQRLALTETVRRLGA
jgi:DNA repair protein RecO (recombination protein O)